MPTASQEYFDASLRHQVGLRRLQAGEARRILRVLEEADRELVRQLRERLARLAGKVDATSERLKSLLDDVAALRAETLKAARGDVDSLLPRLAVAEAGTELALLSGSIPIEHTWQGVSAEQVRASLRRPIYGGATMGQWFKDLQRADLARLERAVRLGFVLGETVPQIVARVAGTRAKAFTDGALAVTRRQAETLVRTGINAASNAARQSVWEANQDVISGVVWTSTLDGRTSPVCRARDGKFDPAPGKDVPPGFERLQPPGARPPAHPNCRSTTVAVLDGEALVGDRPAVTDTRTRRKREIDFRAMAKAQGRSVQSVRSDWARDNIGQVPAKTTYDEWLRRQPAAFQDEVLGKRRAKLFRDGMSLDQFVDRRGNALTLEELGAVT